MTGPSLSEMPVELLLDNLLPLLRTSGLLRLTTTNKFFAVLCSDDTLWKKKVQDDFNFSVDNTARSSGWKFIYRGLTNPKVFVWGERANGRLGLERYPMSSVHGVPFPIQVRIPGARIVNLVAGGMSFHALDSEGGMHVWGTLDGNTPTLSSDGFSDSGTMSRTPMRLQLPASVRSISCGRLHSMCLDRNKDIWNFVSWGRPFKLSSPLLSDPDATPLQIECGWGFSSLLTINGDVLVWWPLSGRMQERIQQNNEDFDQQGDKGAHAAHGVIPCVTWTLDLNPVQLPSLPPLDNIPDLQIAEKRPTQLIRISALDGHIIGLTNNGHVLKFGSLDNETTVSLGRWEYLPKFSEASKLREHSIFSSDDVGNFDPPQSMKITHISANFQHFIAYSTGSNSIVLMGDTGTTPGSEPKIIPALQNKSVISVVLGDYHNAALTTNGKLLTWGAFSSGALGLGDPVSLEVGSQGGFSSETTRSAARDGHAMSPPEVTVPTEVRFDHGRKKPKERFCFATTAAGWHTGALVIDLEPDIDETDDQIDNLEPEYIRSSTESTRDRTWESPPFFPMAGNFRIGYAGRGIFSRGGRGRGGGPSAARGA